MSSDSNPDAVKRWSTFNDRGSRKSGYNKSGVRQRDIVHLREVEGLSFAAIARIIGVSPQAVGQRYRHAISNRSTSHD